MNDIHEHSKCIKPKTFTKLCGDHRRQIQLCGCESPQAEYLKMDCDRCKEELWIKEQFPLTYAIVAYNQYKKDNHCDCCIMGEVEIPSKLFDENSITRAQEVGDIFDTFVEGLEPNRLKD